MNGFRDGILGFFLFFAHWLSPETGKATVDIDFKKIQQPHSAVFVCKMDIAWNKQLEQLIDAGIPLRFKIYHTSDKSDTVVFYRSLHFNMGEFTYTYTDSSSINYKKSKSYSLIELALRDFCKWELIIPDNADICKIAVEILPSKAEQFNKMVDMSRVWGQQKIVSSFDLQKKITKK